VRSSSEILLPLEPILDIELSRTKAYRLRKEAVAWQNVEPEAVLVQLEREEVHVANPAAATIIDALMGGATLPDLVARVTDTFEVDAAQATADVEAFLRSAIGAGLVEEAK
jgi:hypothetical protein